MPRKRGAQPGNKNAYKHGFYAKYFTPFEIKALSDIPLNDMTNEIGLLRVHVDRFMQSYITSLDKLNSEERLAALRTITLAVGRIASLGRILSSAEKNRDEFNQLKQLYDGNSEDTFDESGEYPDIADGSSGHAQE